MKAVEYVTVTKDGITKVVKKSLASDYVSAGWVIVSEKKETPISTIPTFNKYVNR